MSQQIVSLAIEGHVLAGVVVRARIHEHLNARWRIDLELRASRRHTVDELFGANASIEIASDPPRHFKGVVDQVEARASELELTVVPRVALLASTRDHRVFLAKDVLGVLEEVLGEHGVRVEARVRRALAPRAQCVQEHESDLELLERLLAEEGLAWFAASDGERLVVVDEPASFAAIEGASATLPFADDSALAAGEALFEASFEHRLAVDTVRLRDYDHERPAVDQNVEHAPRTPSIPTYEFPGGYRDPESGRAIARRRLESLRARSELLVARATSARLSAGATFAVEGAPRAELNRTWLIVDAELVSLDETALAPGQRALTAQVMAIPATRAPRPSLRPRNRIRGVQTATMTGPAGSEIHTDELGRAKALLRWDRRGASNDSSSHWLRTLQPQTSGAMFLPRVGWEALVAFGSAGADEPYVLGRLDHGAAVPAEKLPGHRVRSAFGTHTTPGGGSKNVLRLDDAAGHEGFLLGASKDHNELTAADKVVSVKADDAHTIGAARKTGVGAALQVNIAGGQTIDIAGARTIGVGASRHLQLASHASSIGAARAWTIGGDLNTTSSSMTRLVGGAKVEVAIDAHHRHVSGASLVVAGAGLTENGGVASMTGVLGTHTRLSGPVGVRAPFYALQASSLSESFGSHTVNAAGALEIRPSATGDVSVKGAASIQGAAGVVIAADSKITIEAGGATITITPSSVTLKGPFKEGENVKIVGKLEVK